MVSAPRPCSSAMPTAARSTRSRLSGIRGGGADSVITLAIVRWRPLRAGDLVRQVRDPVTFDDGGVAQPYRLLVEVLEPPDALAEQHRHQVDADGVQEAGVETLLGDL